MRLMCTMTAEQQPAEFSCYLASQGIENECEEFAEAGHTAYRIWIYDEDRVETAWKFYQTHEGNPHDPVYRLQTERIQKIEEEVTPPPKRRSLLSPAPYGTVTTLLISLSILLFVWAQFGREKSTLPTLPGVVQAPLLSPIEQSLIFDYPPYFVLRDQLLKPDAPQEPLLQQLQHTPVWMGLYDRILMRLQGHSPGPTGLLFYDIGHGQLWRLFTPALLHYDFLHIFFNLLWLIMLGNQIEFRIGPWRYLTMVILIAIISNVGQYVMSGPFFIGLSGIICGLAAFIWARQQIAPWEGYLFNRFTRLFLTLFVLGIFVLQIVSFLLQLFWHIDLSIGIANTAHLVGALVGYSLGRIRRLFMVHSQ